MFQWYTHAFANSYIRVVMTLITAASDFFDCKVYICWNNWPTRMYVRLQWEFTIGIRHCTAIYGVVWHVNSIARHNYTLKSPFTYMRQDWHTFAIQLAILNKVAIELYTCVLCTCIYYTFICKFMYICIYAYTYVYVCLHIFMHLCTLPWCWGVSCVVGVGNVYVFIDSYIHMYLKVLT